MMKTCSKCKLSKELNEFPIAKKEKSGYASACKACNKLDREKNKEVKLARKRSIYQENKEKILTQNKEWRDNNNYKYSPNKEAKATNDKKYYEANKEVIKEKVSAYRTANADKVAKKQKEWGATVEGKASLVATRQKRRGTVNGTDDGTVTTETLILLKEQQDNKCYHCGEVLDYNTLRAVHLDHLVPLSKGGKHTLSNVRWSCAYCNLSKSDKLNYKG